MTKVCSRAGSSETRRIATWLARAHKSNGKSGGKSGGKSDGKSGGKSSGQVTIQVTVDWGSRPVHTLPGPWHTPR